MRVLPVIFAIALVAATVGCRSTPREPPKPKEPEPIRIDWADPCTVVEGFFDAKKRGDWRKAFSCCDFEERLGAAEANKIREEWRRDAPNWPERYRDSFWFVLDGVVKGDLAIVSVVHLERSGLGEHDEKRSGFDELAKRYGDRWKITEFEVPPGD